MQQILSFENVSFRYAENRAPVLHELQFGCVRGESVLITGSNGSGKSTFIRLINGLLLPEEGEVRVLGRSTSSPSDLREIRRHVGMVFQDPDSQIVGATVADDIAFGMENLGLPETEIEQRLASVLSQTGLTPFRHHPPHLLSGGQRQKVAIAGALALEPALLVLDEADAMLDPISRNELQHLIHVLKGRNITILQVTQNVEALAHSDRVVILHQGQIAFNGTPQELLRQQGSIWNEAMLRPPFLVRMRERLQEAGWTLTNDATTEGELAEQVWRFISKR